MWPASRASSTRCPAREGSARHRATICGVASRIPHGLRGLGRIVTQGDILAFVEQQPEVARARLTTLPGWITLATLAGPGNGVPDMESDAFVALADAVRAAMTGPLQVRLLAVTPVLFKLRGTARIEQTVAIDALRETLHRTLDAAFGAGILGFGEAVRLETIVRCVAGVPGIVPGSVAITDLWVPARTEPLRLAILPAEPAQAVDRAGAETGSASAGFRGAEILALSPDVDAVDITFTREGADRSS